VNDVAFLACGALAVETSEIVERRGWGADVHGVSAFLHLYPLEIAPAVDAKLAELSTRYRRVIVVYGDCGTGGRIDHVIERYPAARPAGVHCYQWFAGQDFARIAEEDPGTYFLTDWLVRSWDTAVVHGLGLDRFPWLKETYFGSMTNVLYLQQSHDPTLRAKASEIAAFLGLPLEVRETGVEPLEALLEGLMEETDVHA
jgi:hypothetical protein